MELIFILLGALIALWTLPVIIELTLFLIANLVLWPFASRKPPRILGAPVKKIGFLVPAHNEELTIQRCVENLKNLTAEGVTHTVIVIADNCQDQTAALAKAAGARVLERHDLSVRGKGAALDYGIGILNSEDFDAYIIIDADSVVDPNFLQVMSEEFQSGKEALQCTYLVLNTDAAPKNRLMNLALLSMNVLRPLGRELLGFSAGIMGNGFGLTKKLLKEIPYSANSITEDLEYHLTLISQERKVRFVPRTRVLADFPISKEGTDTQRARWEGGRFMLQRKFALPLLGQIFRGKIRLVEPFLELMSLPLAYEVLLLFLLWILPFQPFAYLGPLGLSLIVLQTLVSVGLHGNKKDFLALFSIPAYLFWKVIRLPQILFASRKDAQWVRTKRDQTPQGDKS